MQAFKLAREMNASQSTSKVNAASTAEVERVLAAKTDYDVMQVRPGASLAAVRKRYRAMTLALHPDKCKVSAARICWEKFDTDSTHGCIIRNSCQYLTMLHTEWTACVLYPAWSCIDKTAISLQIIETPKSALHSCRQRMQQTPSKEWCMPIKASWRSLDEDFCPVLDQKVGPFACHAFLQHVSKVWHRYVCGGVVQYLKRIKTLDCKFAIGLPDKYSAWGWQAPTVCKIWIKDRP